MTDIWIDPPELVATSDLLAQQVQRIQDAATALTGIELPPSLAGFTGEVAEVTKQALQVGLAYVAEALDLRLRAGEVTTDQAQEGFTPGDWTAGMDPGTSSTPASAFTPGDWTAAMEQDSSSTPATAFTPGDWTTGMDPGTSSTPATAFTPGDWTTGMDTPTSSSPVGAYSIDPAEWTAKVTGRGPLVHGGGGLEAMQQSMLTLQAQLDGTTGSPWGLRFDGEQYVDGAGNRGSLADAHPDPHRPGVYEL